jgi:16S rRNA (uracil1498-N3)-methyltransferase
MHIFYQPDLFSSDILLNEEESKHCIRVLRMKRGDEVQLVDGKGTLAIAQIAEDHPKKCMLHIIHREHKPQPFSYYLHIAVAPTKNFDRVEWFIEKAVEVGIHEISFLECENSERAKINMERCEKIAISAMKQSKQVYLPKLNELKSFHKVVAEISSQQKFIAWCETGQEQLLQKQISKSASAKAGQQITILIGPEGDFTKEEVDAAMQKGFTPASFGANRLRTETAALYACMTINVFFA